MKTIIITLFALLLLSCDSGITRSDNQKRKLVKETVQEVQESLEAAQETIMYYESGQNQESLIFDDDEVAIGQIWVYTYDDDNPFEPTKRDTFYVVDVKGEYVQWKCNGKLRNDKIYWFSVGTIRIK